MENLKCTQTRRPTAVTVQQPSSAAGAVVGTIHLLTEVKIRRQWSEHDARGILAAWRNRGLSLKRFAKKRALVPQRIRSWMNELEGSPSKPPSNMEFGV